MAKNTSYNSVNSKIKEDIPGISKFLNEKLPEIRSKMVENVNKIEQEYFALTPKNEKILKILIVLHILYTLCFDSLIIQRLYEGQNYYRTFGFLLVIKIYFLHYNSSIFFVLVRYCSLSILHLHFSSLITLFADSMPL